MRTWTGARDRGPLDDDTLDRLVAGRVDPDDAPPDYRDIARIVGMLRVPPRASELRHEARAVAHARRLLSGAARGRTPERRARAGLRTKVAGLVVVGAVMATGGAAAARVLPEPVQDAVGGVLSRVGIEVSPSSADRPTPAGTPTHPLPSPASQIAKIATTTGATGARKGAEISAAASGRRSRAGEHAGGGEHASADGGRATHVHGPPQTPGHSADHGRSVAHGPPDHTANDHAGGASGEHGPGEHGPGEHDANAHAAGAGAASGSAP